MKVWVFILIAFFVSLTALSSNLKNTPNIKIVPEYKTGLADVCLNELVDDSQVTSEVLARLEKVCPFSTPQKTISISTKELEIYFYQAGIYPVELSNGVRIIPDLRELSKTEQGAWGVRGDVKVPANAELFVYSAPANPHQELRMRLRSGNSVSIVSLKQNANEINTSQALAANSHVSLRLESRWILFEAPATLLHAARKGDSVKVRSGGRLFNGRLADNNIVVLDVP